MKRIIFILLLCLSLLSKAQDGANFKSPSFSYKEGSILTLIESVTATSQILGHEALANGGHKIVHQGLLFNTSSTVDWNNWSSAYYQSNINTGELRTYTTEFTFSPGTTRWVRSFIVTYDTIYGDTRMFTVPSNAGIPSLSTYAASNVTNTTATLNGELHSWNGNTGNIRGFVYSSTYPSPTLENATAITSGNAVAPYSLGVSGLTEGTLYYYRAYATNSAGTGYGNVMTFTPTSGATIPTVTVNTPTNITATTATSGGNVTSDGWASVTARGVCWNTTGNPTTADSKTTDGAGLGTFTSSLTGLDTCTTYYVRAYATNSAGTAYSSQTVLVNTNCYPSLTITGSNCSSIQYSAILNGRTGDCTTKISNGVVIGTSSGVSLSSYTEKYTCNCSSIFSGQFVNLSSSTTYYLKAFQILDCDTVYSDVKSISTAAATQPAVAVLSTVPDISYAVVNAEISSACGYTVTDRGIVWNTTGNPTIANNTAWQFGYGVGTYQLTMTGLSPNTTYYVRAVAATTGGYFYSSQVQVVTTGTPLSVTTTIAANPTTLQITLGGNAVSDGGYSITSKGVVVATTQNPTVSSYLFKTNGGTGIGSFNNSITGLTCATTYYYRAFAINSQDTVYGSQYSFSTPISYDENYYNLWRSSTAYYNSNCTTITVTSEQTAKDAIFLTKYGTQVYSSCMKTASGYTYYIQNSSIGIGTLLYYYSTTPCLITPYRDRWMFDITGDSPNYTYYVVHINANAVIDVYYEYNP